MDYCDFCEKLFRTVERKLSRRDGSHGSMNVRRVSIVKVNDCMKEGMSVSAGEHVPAPTVYFDELYPRYVMGDTVDEIAEGIIEFCIEKLDKLPEEFKGIDDFECAGRNIICRLVNTAANREYLKDSPHRDILDLSVIFYYVVEEESTGNSFGIRIDNRMMERWHTDVDKLYETSVRNTLLLYGEELENMESVLTELSGACCSEIYSEDIAEPMPLFVLTNSRKHFGAVNAVIGSSLSRLADKLEDDLIILPSSVHEVLAVPAHAVDFSIQQLNEWITNINTDVLEIKDILSDHAYVYVRKDRKLEMRA
ncbi:MAG: hypothetical protein HUJ76_04565 [Parasporobacterium sp.]|nr:hypothetical protein [Parasporobacterium sp.]